MNINTDARDRLTTPSAPGPTVTIAEGGRHIELKAPAGTNAAVGGGTRGEIVAFSRAARKRLLTFFNQLDLNKVDVKPLFITLTYPCVYPKDGATHKAHLHAFIKRLLRRYPSAAIIWKLEYQRRGAPHYHLLCFNIPFIPFAFVADSWYACVASGLEEHRRAGTQVQRIRSWNGVLAYAAKYLAKVGEPNGAASPGRFWGIANRDALPRRLLVLKMGWRAWYSVRRQLWRYAKKQQITTGSKTMYIGTSLFIPANVAMALVALATAANSSQRPQRAATATQTP